VTALTGALVAEPSLAVDGDVRVRLAEDLACGVAEGVATLSRGTPIDISLALVRQAQYRPAALLAPPEPFAWKPAFARRSLGLAAVRGCAAGRFRSPAEATPVVAEEALAQWSGTGERTYHWEPWLSGLAPGARAVVLAEAVTWATSLWSSLDWRVLPGDTQIGGPDDVWVCPRARSVRLKSRAEVRVPLGPGSVLSVSPRQPGPPTALVSVSGGHPGALWEEELGYVALVAALRYPARPVPARVAGLWPDAGIFRIVEVDELILSAAVTRAVSTVAEVAAAVSARSTAA
jgi:hypothetical protein